jgi:hypothetical protein
MTMTPRAAQWWERSVKVCFWLSFIMLAYLFWRP